MVFVYPNARPLSFWMRNTCLPSPSPISTWDRSSIADMTRSMSGVPGHSAQYASRWSRAGLRARGCQWERTHRRTPRPRPTEAPPVCCSTTSTPSPGPLRSRGRRCTPGSEPVCSCIWQVPTRMVFRRIDLPLRPSCWACSRWTRTTIAARVGRLRSSRSSTSSRPCRPVESAMSVHVEGPSIRPR